MLFLAFRLEISSAKNVICHNFMHANGFIKYLLLIILAKLSVSLLCVTVKQ